MTHLTAPPGNTCLLDEGEFVKMKSAKVGFTLFLLFLLVSSTWAGTFKDNFDDGNLDGWREIVLLNGPPGSWVVIDGELLAVSPSEVWTRLLTVGNATWKDSEIEFDVKPIEKLGPGNIAIVSRVNGTKAVLCVIGDMPFGKPMVVCFRGNLHVGRVVILASIPYPLLKSEKWHHLKLRANKNLFTLWINGEKVLEFKDSDLAAMIMPLPNGGAGFGLTNYTARFDNITVSGEGVPDNKVGLSVSPQAKLSTTWGRLKKGDRKK